jgi:hypothetical protein
VALFRLDENAQNKFAKAPEIFANIQFCELNKKYLLIVGSRVGVEFDAMTPSELAQFYNEVWAGPLTGLEGPPPGSDDAPISSVIVERYEGWIGSLN